MMHRCTSSQGNMMGPCSCGLFHNQSNCNSFSMLFSMPSHQHHHKSYDETTTDMYSFASASSSSSVDCTLSLGTPSTRLSEDDEKRRRSGSCMSNFCWDILQSKNSPYPQESHKSHRGNNTNNSSNDPLLARRCANCDTTSTPLWRNGPRGPKSLCNACGIRFKKEERRATAANAGINNAATASGVMEQHHNHHHTYHHNSNSSSWVQAQKMQCYSPANEFRFVEESDRDSDTGIPFLSWRLNVTDNRPTSLVHDFTR